MAIKTENSGSSGAPANERFDAIVVGAGFAGLYMLHRLRQDGLRVCGIEAAPDVGGTWYWNRYPGCRCDIESFQYSYQFDKQLQQDWTWKERYAAQPDILAYIEHVADRFDLRRDFRFDTRVTAATFDEAADEWAVVTDAGETLRAHYFILGTGCLSSSVMPDIPGMNDFTGGLYHTGQWPVDGVDFTGRRVGVIGTGSSAVQSIPQIAEQAGHVYVFQRTPNFVVEAQNRPLPADEVAAIKANYDALRKEAKSVFSAYVFPRHDDAALSLTPEQREARLEEHWELGGLQFFGAFSDTLTSEEANAAIVKFWRAKIGEVVQDEAVADLLTPNEVIGCKRLCAGTNYYEVYNRDNVTLVDVSGTGIETFTETGLRAKGEAYGLDDIVCATGFDAMTGSIMRIALTGKGGKTIQDKWRDGPDNYIGVAISGFPNLFYMLGPGGPSVFATMVTGAEHQGDWIADCIQWMSKNGKTRVEATEGAEASWVETVADAAQQTLRLSCNSWYVGANIPGKPRVYLPYAGGFPAYVEKCAGVAAGGYDGFSFDKLSALSSVSST